MVMLCYMAKETDNVIKVMGLKKREIIIGYCMGVILSHEPLKAETFFHLKAEESYIRKGSERDSKCGRDLNHTWWL